MKTEVTSYLQTEVLELVTEPEALDQWHEMVKEMGLEGQGKIAEPNKSPIPYLFMTPAMVATFETLCPREVKLEEYKAGAIPLPALEHIKLALHEGHFDRIMIRYDDKAPDPVAIGEKCNIYGHVPVGDGKNEWMQLKTPEHLEAVPKKDRTYWANERFLITRWGAENDTLENLAAKAKERYLREQGADLNKKIKDAQAKLLVMGEEATLLFNC